MEAFLGALCVFAFFGFVVWIIVYSAGLAKAFREMLGRVARSVPGVRVEEGSWGSPRLRYERGEWDAEVSFYGGSKNSPPYTRFEARLRGTTASLNVRPQGFFSGIAKFFGSQDIEIGDPAFDSRYMISAAPVDFARKFLDSETRSRLDRILASAGGVTLDMGGHRVHLQVPKKLADEGELTEFLQHAEAIAKAAAGERATGVVIVEESRREEGVCQVCGCAMTDRLVQCAKCRTRHHADCWVYYGSCSTFGCGERRNTPI